MSDSNQFGSAGTAVAEPPADEALAASTGRSKPTMIVLAVVLVLVLGGAAYFLLFRGSSADDTATGAVPKASVSAPHGSGAPSASAKPVTSTAPTTISQSGRDPFAALVVASASATSSAGSSSQSTSGTGTTTATTLPSGLTETITLVKLNTSAVTADVTVNGTKYTGVKRGVVFAKYFSLDIIAGTTQAQFHFGDSTLVLSVGKSLTLRT